MSAELVGISLAVDGERGFYVPVGHGSAGDAGQAICSPSPLAISCRWIRWSKRFAPPLENADIPKTAHNAVYDLMILRRYGIDVAPIAFDTMIAEWVNNPISKFLGLKALVAQTLDVQMTEISELLGKGKQQKSMDLVAIEEAAPYAAADATMTWRLVEPLHGRIADERRS